jgi:hypothetical protein
MELGVKKVVTTNLRKGIFVMACQTRNRKTLEVDVKKGGQAVISEWRRYQRNISKRLGSFSSSETTCPVITVKRRIP